MTRPNPPAEVPSAAAMLGCISDPAVVLSADYSILAANRAYRDAFAGGSDVRSRHCYEVSHKYPVPCHQAGESCPLVRSRETGEPCRLVHLHHTAQGEQHEDVILQPVVEEDGSVHSYLEILRPVKIASARPGAERMVGRSPAFRHTLELVERVAPTDTTVLLLGESGTGKELVAEAIHRESRRSRKPFVPVDCSGLTETLFESELFGHEKGSFTGAVGRKKGLVEAAEGGTLFLDELGDIPLSLQVKLLRLLETNRYRRVGSTEALLADFRLICATHRDLEAMVREGKFRQDLYYRIHVFPIPLPSLRERVEDLPLLAESLLQRLPGFEHHKLHPDTLAMLQAYAFPGNVRELFNVLERACLLADGEVLLPEHLPEACSRPGESPVPGSLESSSEAHRPTGIVPLEEMEERYLRWAVDHNSGDNRELAQALGMSERTFYRKVAKLREEDP